MESVQFKQLIQKTFDSVANGYDCDALRFFPASARHLANYLSPAAGEHILDVATGTGAVALAVAHQQPLARITAVDFSQHMLSQARAKAERDEISNIQFLTAEMPGLGDLPSDNYDAACCGFGIFFLEDMVEGMQQIATRLRPGGRLVISSFHEPSFSPLVELFVQRIERYGIEPPKMMWKRIASEEAVSKLFQNAGFTAVRTQKKDVSYFLKDVDEWWSFLWNAGFRGLLSQLSEDDLIRFRNEHLTEMGIHLTEQGLFLRVETLYGLGYTRPSPS